MKLSDLTNEQIAELSESLPGDFYLDRDENNDLVLVDGDSFNHFYQVHSLNRIFNVLYDTGFRAGKISIQTGLRNVLGL